MNESNLSGFGLQPAAIHFENGTPVSERFGDVYYHRASGLAETRHVFLDGNDLGRRFAALAPGAFCTVAELGFGTGLNFCATLRLFREQAPPSARLLYFSCEQFPLSRERLAEALAHWPELDAETRELRAVYPVPLSGIARVWLKNCALNFLFGDANETLQHLVRGTATRGVDAWFLDGFSPAKNPAMWTDLIFAQMARLSAPTATLATYSSAGFVRRGLAAAGFAVRRVPGFANKREMTVGTIDSHAPDPVHAPRRVGVIGGGLAGTAAARACARRGLNVLLLERDTDLARHASGNPAGVLMPAITAQPTALSRFSLAAFRYAGHELADSPSAEAVGALLLEHKAGLHKRYAAALPAHGLPPEFCRPVDAYEAGEIAGLSVAHAGLYFPDGRLVQPRAVCRAAVTDERITVHLNTGALRFARHSSEKDTTYEITLNTGEALPPVDALVLANARDCLDFPEAARYLAGALQSVRGQIFSLPADAHTQSLRSLVCYDGYVTPAIPAADGPPTHLVGATFEHWNTQPGVLPAQNRRIFEQLCATVPQFAAHPAHVEDLPARVAFRTTSRDRLPVLGALPEHPGVFLSVAHGSRGITHAALAAECIAALLCGEIPPIEDEVWDAFSVERFHRRANR